MTASLTMQRLGVEHLLALHADQASTVADAVRDACLTLAFLERHRELYAAIHDLHRRSPMLAELLTAFPGSQIVDVRVPEPHVALGEEDDA